ncbi:MAG: NUDIX hydrolase [Parcubacteria group bacterium]|nr:NUDIX hydrolase [Parcubacteria group bacterium]
MKKHTVRKKYTFAVLAVDVVLFTVIDDTLHTLLIKMKKKPFEGSWALPGGLVKPNEAPNDAAKRILKEKAGISNVYVEQLYTFGKVNRDPFGRVVSVAYIGLVPVSSVRPKTTKEYEDIAWVPAGELRSFAYDHAEIISTAVTRLQGKLTYTNIISHLLPDTFTLGELQDVYEIILKKKLDKRNFRKKILSLHIITKTKGRTSGGAHRPAALYRFSSKKPEIVEIL